MGQIVEVLGMASRRTLPDFSFELQLFQLWIFQLGPIRYRYFRFTGQANPYDSGTLFNLIHLQAQFFRNSGIRLCWNARASAVRSVAKAVIRTDDFVAIHAPTVSKL